MEDSDILSNLNDEQRAAVCADAPHALVLAGAGSGKTRVLTHRVAWLHEQQDMHLEEILVLTFTNKAASEMRGRLRKMLSRPVFRLWFGTFHGICLRILRKHHEKVDLPKDFQVMDSEDQRRFIKRVIESMNLDPKELDVKATQAFINRNKEQGMRAANCTASGFILDRQRLEVYQTYERSCRTAQVVDFAELLLATLELLRDNEALGDYYSKRFKAILVDEFQDTNDLQYAICRLLARNGAQLFVVGDDDQSIYSWRGAQPKNMLNFQAHYPNAAVYRLERNYRSTKNILEVANQLIAQNETRLGKTLRADGDEGEKVILYTALDEREEADRVAEHIREWSEEEGRRLNEVAVLYRSHMQSRALEESLRHNGIDYSIYGGLRFYERAEIKDAMAYLRLVLNVRSDIAFERIINTPTRGIGATTMGKIRNLARNRGISLWNAMELAVNDGTLQGRIATAVGNFHKLIETLSTETKGKPLGEQVSKVIHKSGLYAQYANSKDIQKVSKRENLEELIGDAVGFEDYYRSEIDEDATGETVSNEFLEHTSLDAEQQDETGDSNEDSGGHVQLMTLHAAKGLEFPFVIMTGLEDDLLPHRLSLEEGNVEEERRLCYVGITRARERLLMLWAKSRFQMGESRHMRQSRFISELPRKLLDCQPMGEVMSDEHDEVEHESHSSNDSGQVSVRHHGKDAIGDGMKLIGHQVRHPKFGEGIVNDCEGDGEALRVLVIFDNAEKWLVWHYAKLELVD